MFFSEQLPTIPIPTIRVFQINSNSCFVSGMGNCDAGKCRKSVENSMGVFQKHLRSLSYLNFELTALITLRTVYLVFLKSP
jgi:hypothetical protein